MKAVVVVEPENPDNTGFIARLCANFGFSLRLVNPSFNLEEARKTAKRAQDVLRDAEIYSSVDAALNDLDYVAGTKPGRGTALSGFKPRENTSLMVGRESSGLTREELELCDTTLHLETAGYESLNQSHAAAVFMHQLSHASKKGMTPEQKQHLESLVDPFIFEVLVRGNPSKGEADRIIGRLKDRD